MRTDPTAPPLRPASSGPLRAREAGLALTRRVNRWMIGGAVILTGGVSAVTAHAFHARSPTVTGSSAPAAARRSHAGAGSASTASTNGSGQGASLQAPSQPPNAVAPAPATAPAPVVSGGS